MNNRGVFGLIMLIRSANLLLEFILLAKNFEYLEFLGDISFSFLVGDDFYQSGKTLNFSGIFGGAILGRDKIFFLEIILLFRDILFKLVKKLIII